MNKNDIVKIIKIFLVCALFLLMSIVIYKKTINTIYVEGTVNVIDSKTVISFDRFAVRVPSELEMPKNYNFPKGSKVKCKIRTITILELRYFKVKDVSLVN